MSFKTKHLLLASLFSLSLVDKETLGLKISLICLAVYFGGRFLFIKKEQGFRVFFKRPIVLFYSIYIIAVLLSILYGSYHLITYLLLLFLLAMIYRGTLNLTRAFRMDDYIRFYSLYIRIILVLLVVDILFMTFLNWSPWMLLATNPENGYKNHQLFSNEPNWLSSLIVLLWLTISQYRDAKSSSDILTLVSLVILGSRIAIVVFLVIFLFRKTSKTTFILSTSLGVGVILVLYSTGLFRDLFYDIIDLDRNPRLNDFFFINELESPGNLIWMKMHPGALWEITPLIPWRGVNQIVLNSYVTQFYFELGLIGLLSFCSLFLLSFRGKGFLIAAIILCFGVVHNGFFKPHTWLLMALMTNIEYLTYDRRIYYR